MLAPQRIGAQFPPMSPPLGTVLIYARDMRRTADFYRRHFGFESSGEVIEGLITANGYAFANAKDPDGNNIAISSRAFRPPRSDS
jgi:predicted enzyme related to lactoylglutathione lyase